MEENGKGQQQHQTQQPQMMTMCDTNSGGSAAAPGTQTVASPIAPGYLKPNLKEFLAKLVTSKAATADGNMMDDDGNSNSRRKHAFDSYISHLSVNEKIFGPSFLELIGNEKYAREGVPLKIPEDAILANAFNLQPGPAPFVNGNGSSEEPIDPSIGNIGNIGNTSSAGTTPSGTPTNKFSISTSPSIQPGIIATPASTTPTTIVTPTSATPPNIPSATTIVIPTPASSSSPSSTSTTSTSNIAVREVPTSVPPPSLPKLLLRTSTSTVRIVASPENRKEKKDKESKKKKKKRKLENEDADNDSDREKKKSKKKKKKKEKEKSGDLSQGSTPSSSS